MIFNDNSSAVKTQMEKNIGKCLESLGLQWVNNASIEINNQPNFGESGGSGAVDTGLMRASNTYRVEKTNKHTIVGNPLNYALYTTYGTWKMPQRPWFQNSINNHMRSYEDVANAILENGF